MLLYSYYAVFFISVLLLGHLTMVFRNRINGFYVLLFCSMIVTNFGYMQMAGARSTSLANQANQVLYLGASFTPFFMILCLADLCKIKLKRFIVYFYIAFSILCFVLSSTGSISDLYYKNVYLVSNHGVHLLKKIYGPMHYFYPVYLISANFVGVFIIIQSFFQRKTVSHSTIILLMFVMSFSMVFYILERKSGFDVPLVPYGNVIAEFLVYLLLLRIRKYDLTIFASHLFENATLGGIISFDWKGRFLGGDDQVTEWFPELKKLRVDSKLKNEETDLLKQIGKWVRLEDDTETIHLRREGKYIEVRHSTLRKKSTGKVHCFFCRDDTNQQEYNERLRKEVKKQTRQIREIQSDVNLVMANIVENRDNNTGGHIIRTSDVVRIFVNHLVEKGSYSCTAEFLHHIEKAAPLHDFGKIGVPDAILNKPGKFTPEEYEQMKIHPSKGAELVEQILRNVEEPEFRKIAVNVAHYHHEKWDGSGYPKGISGQNIPFEARVMALADVFDALVSKRVYKEKFSYDKAFEIIKESAGSHFDPGLTEAFLECRPQLITLYDGYDE